jgi:hypothetical protein
MLDRLGFVLTLNVKGRASIADLFKANERRGIYVLHFSNGEFYAGQATDVTRRYVQHRTTHRDIEKISFKPVIQDCLNEEERSTIWQLEQEGWPLRNIVFTSSPRGESDFDLIMSSEEQQQWLDNPTVVDNKGERLVDPELRRKFRNAYERFLQTPYANDIIDILKIYVSAGIPAIRRGEVSFWCLSCRARRHGRVNIYWQEVLTPFIYEKELWLSLHMARSPLEKAFGNDLSRLFEQYPMADYIDHKYEPGGQDQTSFEIPAIAAGAFITDPAITSAIRLLNLRLMKKGPCNWGRFHCMDFADRVIGEDSA